MDGKLKATRGQLRILAELAASLPSDAYLAGGVAVAAHLRHRSSHDVDIFTTTSDPAHIAPVLSDAPKATVVSRSKGTLYLEIEALPVSIICHPYPLLHRAMELPGFAVPVASLGDLTAMKLHAIASRGAARDFWDLYAMLLHRKLDVPGAIAEHQQRYPNEDAGHVVRSLAYFGDAEAGPLPKGLGLDLWADIQRFFEDRVAGI